MALTFIPQSPRDFLASLTPPLAIPNSRGRFSTEGKAALDKARAEGFRFIGDPEHPDTVVKVVKAPKAAKTVTTVKATTVATPSAAPAPSAHPAAAKASFDAKEVRAWAKANGHAVGDRGRIHATVIAAFAKAGGKAVGPKAKAVTPLSMPKVRPQTAGYIVERNSVIAFSTCGGKGVGCRKPISSCTCSTGPVAPHYLGDLAGKPLALVKPVV